MCSCFKSACPMASREVCAVEGSSELTALAVVGAGAEPSGTSGVGSMGRRTNALAVQIGSAARSSSPALWGLVSSWT